MAKSRLLVSPMVPYCQKNLCCSDPWHSGIRSTAFYFPNLYLSLGYHGKTTQTVRVGMMCTLRKDLVPMRITRGMSRL